VSRRLLAATLAALALLGLLAAAAFGSHGTHLVTVAEGGAGLDRWEVAIGSNRDHEPCFRVNSGSLGLITCGGLLAPEGEWARRAGASADETGRSVEVNVTSPRVRRLRLLIGHPDSGRKPSRRWFSPQLLTEKQAGEAHLSRNFRYVVFTERGESCVEGVKGLDRRGRAVVDERVPCEY
jgi:hypothetical protein